ncbi:hypothetical protein CAPTEDRAFT_229238 [Capitella teleta]|uniref:KIF-binding protein n=1 Tax=Capitella teleta TaxID=283909 RepID=R7V3X9_CAPTE|nr:hypothetical protein CAPTEDRAFT_229238 [Capitella teleta]|eukprot:ELU13558.1 hypothetical protein CAPTEDRAFT_229238 [Capitella teleta]
MASTAEFLRENISKFEEADRLFDIESKTDPENEPYKSKYAAREIWHGLRRQIDEILERGETDPSAPDGPPDLEVLRGVLDVKLAGNYADTEELATGEEILNKCIGRLEKWKLHPMICSIVQRAYNELGILWTGRRQPDKAKDFLLQAKQIYWEYKKEVDCSPHSFKELTEILNNEQSEDERVQKRLAEFENAYTHTLYFLAQVYVQLGEADTGAFYCHETLRRQLDSMKYDPFDWAMNAATLSQYFMTNEDFVLARHCLTSAECILKEYGEKPENLQVAPLSTESNDELVDREKLPKAWADLYRCYVKYSLALMDYSRNRLYQEMESPNENSASKEEEDEQKRKSFFNLELTVYEEKITDQHLLVFADARKVFLIAQQWINSAEQFYTLDGHCTDHVELVQDHSKLYKLLAFFELNFGRQSKMQKRRVDMLKKILDEISPQFYMMIYRQVQFELAETYSEMLNNKMAIQEASNEPPTPQAIKKINALCQQSIDQFQAYLKSLDDQKTKAPPPKYAEEDERPVLIAHFCLGRLHSKFRVFDAKSKLQTLAKSLAEFSLICDYCERNPSATEKVKAEIELCKEMVTLLPAQMDKIRAHSLS